MELLVVLIDVATRRNFSAQRATNSLLSKEIHSNQMEAIVNQANVQTPFYFLNRNGDVRVTEYGRSYVKDTRECWSPINDSDEYVFHDYF